MSEKIFVSGIDTDAGKTYATGYMARKLMENGNKVATVKFIQTGCEGWSEDILKHREIMGCELEEDQKGLTAPIIFRYPASAQLAARLDQSEIDLQMIDKALEELEKKYDVILIEGAGGLMVPIKDDYFTIDFIRERNYPVALVTNGALGSINHTILSLEAIKSRNIHLHSLLYNTYFDEDKIIVEDTKGFLQRYVNRRFPEAKWDIIPIIRS